MWVIIALCCTMLNVRVNSQAMNPPYRKTTLHLNQCIGGELESKLCRVSNLCFSGIDHRWFQYVPGEEKASGEYDKTDVGRMHGGRFAYMSPVSAYTHGYWSWGRVGEVGGRVVGDDAHVAWSPDASPNNPDIRIINTPVQLTARFHPSHPYHSIHDELLELWHVRKYFHGDTPRLHVFLDGHLENEFDAFMRAVIPEWRYFWREVLQVGTGAHANRIVCFRDALIGTTKHILFQPYEDLHGQHSFLHDRKPSEYAREELVEFVELERKAFNGTVPDGFIHKRQAYFRQTLQRLKAGDATAGDTKAGDTNAQEQAAQPSKEANSDMVIVLMGRNRNRLILNERELANMLSTRYRLPVIRVAEEEMGKAEMVQTLSKAAMVVGMHGALSIFGLWMPVGGIMVEGLPYGVSPDICAHYRRMCAVMGHHFKAWLSPYPGPPKSVGRRAWMGGLANLPPQALQVELQKRWAPFFTALWTYRLFHDTFLDLPDIMDLIDTAMAEALSA